VNLRPGKPYSVIDGEFSRTDFGKVLLAADLRLKKDTSELTNPRSAKGKEYWDRLYRKAEELGIAEQVPSSNRVWIVPGEVAVSEGAGGVAILKSNLRVRLEPDGGYSGDQRLDELRQFAAQLMQELIVPSLEKKINEHYAYWELRQAFRMMVLARWYKRVTGQAELPRENLLALDSDYACGADDIYSDYLDSLKKGEYSVTETQRNKFSLFLQLVTRSYVSGGVDWREDFEVIRERGAAPEQTGTLQFTCTFVMQGGGRGLAQAKDSFSVDLFAAARDKRFEITPELFRMLPSPSSRVTIGRQVEQVFSGEAFRDSL
jgi:hypothetical protein